MRVLCSYCGGKETVDLQPSPKFDTALSVETKVQTGQVFQILNVCEDCMRKSGILAIDFMKANNDVVKLT